MTRVRPGQFPSRRSPADQRPTVYNVDPAGRRTGALRPQPARQRRLPARPTSPGRATTTRASRSTSPETPLRQRSPLLAKWRGPQEPPRLRRPAPATAPSSPPRPPASAPKRPPSEARLLDLPAGRLDRRRGTEPGYVFPRRPARLRVADPAGEKPNDCDTHPLRPVDRRRPRTPTQTDSPAGRARSNVDLPHIKLGGDEPARRSQSRTAKVTLPPGMGLNPSAANGPAGLHRRRVRQGHAEPGRLPGGLAGSAPSRSRRRRCPTVR